VILFFVRFVQTIALARAGNKTYSCFARWKRLDRKALLQTLPIA